MHKNLTVTANDESATLALGAELGRHLTPGCTIWLAGDLGAGKTTLVRGLLRARGEQGNVKSPTYTLVEVHVLSGLNFYHFDFYRFNHPEEYLDAGLDEYFAANGVCLVEWADRAQPYLPAPDMQIELHLSPDGDESAREIHLRAFSDMGAACLAAATSSISALPG